MDLAPIDTSVTLPVRQIIDANLAWVRRDVGPLGDELQDHMQQHGPLLPVLLTKDMIVADGARRVVRAKELGWRTIPVRITTDWDVVERHYARRKELATQGVPTLPMTWQETLELVDGPLDRLYQLRRRERGRETRARNRQLRAGGAATIGGNKHEFVTAVSRMLGWKTSDLRTVREIAAALHTLENREGGKEIAADFFQEMYQCEIGNDSSGLYSLLRRVRLTNAGKDTSHIRPGRAKRRVGDPTLLERKARAAVIAARSAGLELSPQTMRNFAATLSNLGAEANAYSHLHPAVMGDDARSAAEDMKRAVIKFNRLIRMMKDHAESLEEERAEP